MEFPDKIYKPQFDVTARVTVTQPYREERCIYVSGRYTSNPTGKTKGYCYYNTIDKIVRIRGDSDEKWIDVAMKTRDEGYLYWVATIGAFYEWTGSALSQLSGNQAWNHVYIRTLSFVTVPTNAELGDWYFDPATASLYYYDNYKWVSYGTPWTTINYLATALYANGNRLWYYYPSDTSMHPYYGMIRFGIYQTGPFVYQTQIGETIAFDYTFAYPGDDNAHTYSMLVNWYDEYGISTQWMPESGRKYEQASIDTAIQGRNGSISTSLSWIEDLATYPTVADEFSGYLLCSPSSENTASILVPIDTSGLQASDRYGVTWKLAKTGGEGGTFSSITLADAVTLGYVVLSTTYNQATYNQSKRSFRLKYAGDYTLTAEYKYRNSLSTLTTGSQSLAFRVYAKASPKIEISTNPAPTPDPEIYPPPYTVVLHDASVTSNPYQIPMRTITMDAGDSADSESWTLENEEPYPLITIPDKIHVYNGYGPYRPSITITDMNDNTEMAYAQFAPNKDARIYADPKITCDGIAYAPGSAIDGGEAPILLICNAYVAGSPLPDVEWRYALHPASEYYQGEKEGAFAELSLLAGGIYDLKCMITNGNEVLGEYTWTASATSAVIEDTPVSLQDFVIWIYDASGMRVGRIVPTSAQYVDRFAHASYCEFSVPMDYAYLNHLTPGCELAFGYLGKARLMIVTGFAEDDAGDFVTITAKDAASVALESRIATTATTSTSGNGYDVQTCSAEALLRYFAVSNARTGNRTIARMRVVGACQDRGGRTTYSARYETILSIFEDICTDSGLGWDSALQSTTENVFSLQVVAGVDRTYTLSGGGIIFEERRGGRGSAALGSYSGFLPANLAIAAGEGDGSSREYKEYGATTSTGLHRREVFVDAGESADELEMQREAEAELKKQDEQSIMVYPNQDVYRIGTDYNVGDYVTVISKSGIMLHLQIIQANYSLDETGRTLSLECGSDLRDYQKLIRETKLANSYARK